MVDAIRTDIDTVVAFRSCFDEQRSGIADTAGDIEYALVSHVETCEAVAFPMIRSNAPGRPSWNESFA